MKYFKIERTRFKLFSKPLLLILCLNWFVLLHGQNSVFVLVDVSASGPNNFQPRSEAKNIVQDICSGDFVPHSLNIDWKWADYIDNPLAEIKEGKGQLLNKNNNRGYIMIMPFGDKDTYKNYHIEKRSKLNNSFKEFYQQYYPSIFKDGQTYISIARASTADIAIKNEISSYFLIEITDGLPDTDSKEPGYTTSEEQLIAQYGTAYIIETRLGTLRYEAEKKNYQIIFKSVQIKTQSEVSSPKPNPELVKPPEPKIKLVRPQKKGKQHATTLKRDKLDVIWTCPNCPEKTKFIVRLDCLDCRGEEKKQSKSSSKTKVNFDIKDKGLYKLTISTKGVPSTSTYVTLQPTSSGENKVLGVLLILFIFLVIGLIGYKHFMNNQKNIDHEKPARPASSTPPTPSRSPTEQEDIEDIFNNF